MNKGKLSRVRLKDREQKKYERYPLYKDGRRVTDAALVPIILNTYGGVGVKAIEFLYAVAGKEAKRIIDEISLLAVLLSAEMILISHAPSNLPNLFPAKQADKPATEAMAPQSVSKQPAGEVVGEKDENGFLRSELRGELQGKKVECLACSKEDKKFFSYAAAWYWNRHVQRAHMKAAQCCAPAVLQAAQPAPQTASKRVPKQDVGAVSLSSEESGREGTGAQRLSPAQPGGESTGAKPKKLISSGKQTARVKAAKPVVQPGDKSFPKHAKQKQQGSVESRKARATPSKNSDSDESQARKRTDLVQIISNSAVVPKIDNLSSTFSVKSASSKKK